MFFYVIYDIVGSMEKGTLGKRGNSTVVQKTGLAHMARLHLNDPLLIYIDVFSRDL